MVGARRRDLAVGGDAARVRPRRRPPPARDRPQSPGNIARPRRRHVGRGMLRAGQLPSDARRDRLHRRRIGCPPGIRRLDDSRGDRRRGRGYRRHRRDAARRRHRRRRARRVRRRRPPIALRPEQRVLPNLLFTSGTTGRPKAVQLPPKTIGRSADLAGFVDHITAHRLAKLGTHLVVGPMYHNGPLTGVRLLLAGVPVVVHERFDAEATLAAIDALPRSRARSWCRPTSCGCLALPAEVRGALRRLVAAARSPTPEASARSTSSGR